MADLEKVVADNRQAVSDFVAAATAIEAADWGRAPAEGKWSPGQVTEHVAISYELSQGILHGTFPGRGMPSFLRPLIRVLALKPVLRKGRFGRPVKTFPAFEPAASPTAAEAITARLQKAADSFEEHVQTAAASGKTALNHPFFGNCPLTDYMLLQVIHTNHHRGQLTRNAH